jgi:MFS family permease
MNQFVGPPLGGLLIGFSVPLVLASSAVGYALAALGLSLIVGTFRPQREPGAMRLAGEIVEGLRYLWRSEVLRTLAIMVGVLNLAATATFTLLPLYAVVPGPMGLSEPGFGVLLTTFALGSLAGSFLAARLERRFGRVPLLFAGVVAIGLGMGVPAVTTSAIAVGGAFVVSGALIVVWNVITVSLRQRIVPDHLLGRVNAAYRLFAWGTQPLGALVGGLVGEWLGLRAVFVLSAAVAVSLLVARFVITEGALQRAEESSGPAGQAAAAT